MIKVFTEDRRELKFHIENNNHLILDEEYIGKVIIEYDYVSPRPNRKIRRQRLNGG